jgi:hypothetical protein
LYNLETDISEQHNLAKSETVIANRLNKLLSNWRNNNNVQTNSLNPNFNPELHRKLYIDSDPSLFNPLTTKDFQQILEWRKLMDEVVKMKRQ